jgi:NADH:ubiquinone oxidoreductase subunit F (NADH-binding)
MKSPIPVTEDIEIVHGPALLADPRSHARTLNDLDLDTLAGLAEAAHLRGRGGAGFPFARKLRATADARRRGRRPVVVVNAAEGEPASAKDAALARTNPHLPLDGAAIAAQALGAREIHIVVPGDRPLARAALEDAVAERTDRGLRWQVHAAAPRFVSGQSRAVIELLAGRPGLPVTSWQPEAIDGHRGRPTLLSNLETWAHVGLLARDGAFPETTLLTVHRPGRRPTVLETSYGGQLVDHTGPVLGPVLLGGFHGTWASSAAITLDPECLNRAGLSLGAGVVIVPDRCALALTSDIVAYLAVESAGRCGPCVNGLPALARALGGLAGGDGDALDEVQRLCAMVNGRGACAHPDGTARLVDSLLAAVPDEVAAHATGGCALTPSLPSLPGPRRTSPTWDRAR